MPALPANLKSGPGANNRAPFSSMQRANAGHKQARDNHPGVVLSPDHMTLNDDGTTTDIQYLIKNIA